MALTIVTWINVVHELDRDDLMGVMEACGKEPGGKAITFEDNRKGGYGLVTAYYIGDPRRMRSGTGSCWTNPSRSSRPTWRPNPPWRRSSRT